MKKDRLTVQEYNDIADTKELFNPETYRFIDPNFSIYDWQDSHICIHAESYYSKCFAMDQNERIWYLQYNPNVKLKLSPFLSKVIHKDELKFANV